jgi:hypothetical protein
MMYDKWHTHMHTVLGGIEINAVPAGAKKWCFKNSGKIEWLNGFE